MMMMTERDFLDLLPIARGRGWWVSPDDGWLRDSKGCCPICAVVDEVDPLSPYATMTSAATARIGLVMFNHDRRMIETAADCPGGPTRHLRAKMCAILGVAP